MGRGRFELRLQPIIDGEHDVWLEITRSGQQHIVDFLERYSIVARGAPRLASRSSSSVECERELAPVAQTARPARFRFTCWSHGRRVQSFGRFAGVEAHVWGASRDGQFLVHDHGVVLEDGTIEATLTFPLAGEYYTFPQPTVLSDGQELRPVLRYVHP